MVEQRTSSHVETSIRRFKKTQCLPVASPAASAEICAALTHACAHHCGLVIPAHRQGDDYKTVILTQPPLWP